MIKLPSGIKLDMEQGEVRTPLGPGPIPINHNSQTFSSYSNRRTLWDRYDDFISRIGNWLADYSENITSILAILLLVCGGLVFIIWLFTLGLFWGIVAGVFLGGIVYYALMIVTGVFIWIGNIALGVVRYIFYNGWTFLIAFILLLIFCLAPLIIQSQRFGKTESIENTITSTSYYQSNAKVLNIRSEPNTDSNNVIGSIRRGERIEVYAGSTINGFAKVKYNGRDGYASLKYLQKTVSAVY